jgi:hypothetical protein
MTLNNLRKTDNDFVSNWTDSYNNTVFIIGTIQPFTYKAEYTDTESDEISWFIADQYVLDKLKTEISKL